MFHARLSWIVVGAIVLLGAFRDAPSAARAILLLGAVIAFGWLNRPHLKWLRELRKADDERWRPIAYGLALRCVGLVLAVAMGW
jgi:hypothetical protein